MYYGDEHLTTAFQMVSDMTRVSPWAFTCQQAAAAIPNYHPEALGHLLEFLYQFGGCVPPQHVSLETWSPVQFLLHSYQSESRPPYFEIYSHLIKCLRTMTMEAHSSETSDANPSTRLDSLGREPLKDLRLLYSFGDGSVSHLLKLTPKFTIPIRIYSFCWLALSSWIPLKWKPW